MIRKTYGRATHQRSADSYWAAEQDPATYSAALVDRIRRFYDDARSSGRVDVWRRQRDLYFGRDPDSDRSTVAIHLGGNQGETVELRINHFRSLLQHVYGLTTATRPAFESKADNGDSRTMAQRQIADAILTHYLDEPGGLEDAAKQAAEYAIALCEGYLYQWWDDQAGEPYGVEPYLLPEDEEKLAAFQQAMAAANDNAQLPEEPQVQWQERLLYQGGPRFLALPPEDLIRDPDLESTDWQWVMVRCQTNRWDLAAQYPEHADLIKADTTDRKRDLSLKRIRSHASGSDLVETWKLYHKKTSALPQGRYSILVGDTVIHDGSMPYRRLPVHAMVPGHEFQEAYGYGASMDLLAIQQARDSIASIVVSNIEALGLQKVWTRRGSGVETYDLGHGLMNVQSDEKPEPLKLLESTDTQEKALQWLRQEGELSSGINATTRGDAPANIKSGVAQAFAHSMSIQANSPTQDSWQRFLQSAATGLIEIHQDFAQAPRIIEIAGAGKSYQAQQFTADDIKGIRRVSVNLGNPMMRALTGRVAVADQYLEKGLIDARQHMALVENGRLEDITASAEAFKLLIASESEKLRSGVDEEGKPIKVLVGKYDPHHLCIKEAYAILADPMIRYDQGVVARVYAYMDEHAYWWAYLSRFEPDNAAALEIPPAPPRPLPIMPPPDAMAAGAQPIMPLPPPMPMGGPGAPPGGPGAPPGPGGPPPDAMGGAPQPGPGMPGMPQGAEVPPDVAAQATNPGVVG